MTTRYRICTIRGEVRDPKDPGSDSLTQTVLKATELVKSGRAFPGLTVWEWTYGAKAATITSTGVTFHEHF